MGVRYCQDFTATLALADGRVSHLNEPIYWYEWGTGISTGGSLASRKKLYADHMRFYTEMSSRKPLGANLNKAVAFFRIKQFVALNTPIYSALTKLLDQSFNSASLETPNAFFFECMTARESNVSIR